MDAYTAQSNLQDEGYYGFSGAYANSAGAIVLALIVIIVGVSIGRALSR